MGNSKQVGMWMDPYNKINIGTYRVFAFNLPDRKKIRKTHLLWILEGFKKMASEPHSSKDFPLKRKEKEKDF